MVKKYENCYTTIGIHPCHAQDEKSLKKDIYDIMDKYIIDNKQNVVAVGECGLDYDRLHFADKKS